MNIDLHTHKTKIVCTIGPSSNSPAVIGSLIKAGMNVARLNLSHGTIPEHIGTLKLVRAIARRLNKTVGIMVDLPGPKIRVGIIKNTPMLLKKHDIVTLAEGTESNDRRVIPVDYKGLTRFISGNGIIYLNDGFIQLKVLKIHDGRISCKVIIGGTLLSHKGLNIPGVRPGISAVTNRDLNIIDKFSDHGADIFNISFVQGADDVIKAGRHAKKRGTSPLIIAKIERGEAVRHIDSILDAADGIMVARGDLGVEIPIEQVPVVQKMLIRKANDKNKIVITATQMLLSMTEHIRPTRAEVTDVANAILDGTDAVMLSEETAMGDYPVDAVKMMTRIASITESKRKEFGCSSGIEARKIDGVRKHDLFEDRITFDVKGTIESMQIRMVITHNISAGTAHGISRFKPDCWILCVTNDRKSLHLLNLSYGVCPLLKLKDTPAWRKQILELLHKNGLLEQGDRILQIEESIDKKGRYSNSLNIVTV